MPEITRATNPVPGYDVANNNRNAPVSPNDPRIQNIPDPSKVVRPDGRTDQQDSGDIVRAPRYDSNVQTFFERLRATPGLTETLARVFSGRGAVVSSGIGEGLAAEMSRILEMLQMNESQLTVFLKNQLQSGARFGGALFSLLRSVYNSTQAEGLRTDILSFLKRYSDFSSTGHIQGNIMRSLSGMARAIPASWANPLLELIGKLQNSMDAGDRAGSLKLLQGQIFPYMSDYIEKTHDMGAARSLLTFLTLDIARYENGSEEGLLQSFRQLSNYGVLREKLGGLDDASVMRLLRNTDFVSEAGKNQFADRMAAASARALRGEGSAELQSAFRDIVSALLINESVYMPLSHILIPMQWDGRMMFSELWVDPDADREQDAVQEGGNTLRFLFKMDIQQLGLFDVVLSCRGESVDLRVYCPQTVAPFSRVIEGALTGILTDNGLSPASIQVSQMEKPLTISEVFPRIFEGMNSINVKA